MAGLAFSLAGDLLLELPGDYFVPGLTAFLVGHLSTTPPFFSADRRLLRSPELPSWTGQSLSFCCSLPARGVHPAVLVYVCVLFTMMWRAAARCPATEGISRECRPGSPWRARCCSGSATACWPSAGFLGPYPWLDYP
jgi:uncharacterized membrane protein YhhN